MGREECSTRGLCSTTRTIGTYRGSTATPPPAKWYVRVCVYVCVCVRAREAAPPTLSARPVCPRFDAIQNELPRLCFCTLRQWARKPPKPPNKTTFGVVSIS